MSLIEYRGRLLSSSGWLSHLCTECVTVAVSMVNVKLCRSIVVAIVDEF